MGNKDIKSDILAIYNLPKYMHKYRDIKNNSKMVDYLNSLYVDLNVGDNLKEILFLIAHNTTIALCEHCGNKIKFSNTHNTYRSKYCCRKCLADHDKLTGKTAIRMAKTKKTCEEKYGGNPLANPEIRKKVLETSRKKYGADNVMQSEFGKKKFTDSMMQKYGKKWAVEVPEIREKIKNGFNEKYGTDNPLQSPIVRCKIISTVAEKYHNGHHTRNHITEDNMKILRNKYELEKFITEYGTGVASQKLGVNSSTLYNYIYSHGLSLPDFYRSKQEMEVCEFLTKINIAYETNNRTILSDYRELDIYIPSCKLAIEINGIYWHSDGAGKDKSYHYNKWKECDTRGINLLSITDNEWNTNRTYFENKILYTTGLLNNIPNEDCFVDVVKDVAKAEFLNSFYITGDIETDFCYGLYHSGELISLMAFSFAGRTVYLKRICSKYGVKVIGGESKLLSYFIEKHGGDYDEIISISDNRYSSGGVYIDMGFSLDNDLPAECYYTNDYINLIHHSVMRMELGESMTGIDDYDVYWDCGRKKWKMNI